MNKFRVTRNKNGPETCKWWLETRPHVHGVVPWTVVGMYPTRALAKAAETTAFQREIAVISDRLHVTHTHTTEADTL
jgi:hypothetical protein